MYEGKGEEVKERGGIEFRYGQIEKVLKLYMEKKGVRRKGKVSKGKGKNGVYV